MKNYFAYPLIITIIIVLIMTALSVVPKEFISGDNIKEINIFSDIIDRELLCETIGLTSKNGLTDTTELSVCKADSTENISIDTLLTTTKKDTLTVPKFIVPDSIIPIEDFSDSGASLIPFFESLMRAANHETSRIAFMGDSFIEGDILTSDLRSLYQKKYSGNGVGFVPFYSQVAAFRQTVGHTSEGWEQHSIINDDSCENYILSNYIFTLDNYAMSEYQIRKSKNISDNVARAVVVFKNENNTHLEAEVNGGDARHFDIAGEGGKIQSLTIKENISTLKLTFSNTKGLIGYGVYFDDIQGVYVDNYSVRGSSGAQIAKMNPKMSREINNIVPINLLVLQYGLNTVVDNKSNFKYYKIAMTKSVNGIKKAYPGVPILMLGVSGQSIKKDGKYVINPSVALLEEIQREIAKETKVAFWSVNSAVTLYGGMGKLVNAGCASKDYTHINIKGGAIVANMLFKSLEYYKIKMVGDMKWEEYLKGFSVVKDESIVEEEMVEIVENEKK